MKKTKLSASKRAYRLQNTSRSNRLSKHRAALMYKYGIQQAKGNARIMSSYYRAYSENEVKEFGRNLPERRLLRECSSYEPSYRKIFKALCDGASIEACVKSEGTTAWLLLADIGRDGDTVEVEPIWNLFKTIGADLHAVDSEGSNFCDRAIGGHNEKALRWWAQQGFKLNIEEAQDDFGSYFKMLRDGGGALIPLLKELWPEDLTLEKVQKALYNFPQQYQAFIKKAESFPIEHKMNFYSSDLYTTLFFNSTTEAIIKLVVDNPDYIRPNRELSTFFKSKKINVNLSQLLYLEEQSIAFYEQEEMLSLTFDAQRISKGSTSL